MILALDIGATHIRAALVKNRKVYKKITLMTPKKKAEIKKAIFKLIDSYASKTTICLGIAAFIKDGKTKTSWNMDFSGVNIKKILKDRYRMPVFVDNDAKCAGLGELVYGNGKGKNNFVLLTLGTGIGGAIIINKKLFRGTGFAGEPGHMVMGRNSFEDLASGSAAAKLAKLKNIAENSIKLSELAKKGDKKAETIFEEVGINLGKGLLNIAYILDPEAFIVGGGFSNSPKIVEKSSEYLKKYDKINRNIPVIKAKLGDNAGLIGAALLVKGM